MLKKLLKLRRLCREISVKLERPYLVQPLDGFSPRIGELVVMMTYTRDATLWVFRKLNPGAA